jgi:hypothetical protein
MDGFNKKQLILYQLKWMAIYFGTAFVIMILLPFPIDLAVALPVFLLISLYRRNLLLRKLGVDYRSSSKGISADIRSIKDFFRSISSNASDSTVYGHRPIKYYCMNCGNEHKEITCPKCGSKIKRVGY